MNFCVSPIIVLCQSALPFYWYRLIVWIPFAEGVFMQSLFEFCQVVLEKKMFECLNSFFDVIIYWELRIVLHMNKLEFPPPKDTLCQVLLVSASGYDKNTFKRVSIQKDRPMNRRQTLAIRKSHLNSQLLWSIKTWRENRSIYTITCLVEYKPGSFTFL